MLQQPCCCVVAAGGVVVCDNKTQELRRLPLAGLFFAIGHAPATAFLGGQLELDEYGYIVTAPDSTSTSIPGEDNGDVGSRAASGLLCPSRAEFLVICTGSAPYRLDDDCFWPCSLPWLQDCSMQDWWVTTSCLLVAFSQTRTAATAVANAGVFAAGDVQDRKWRQAITAAGSGA